VAALGRGAQAGFETAISKVNKAGGVNGHQIETKVYDAQTNPSTASVAIRQAISSNPQAIFGFLASYEFTPSLAVVNAAKVPWIEGSTVFSGLDTPYFFAMLASPKSSALALVAATKQQLGGSLSGKRIVLEGNSPSSFMDPSIATYKAAAEQQGAQVVLTIRDSQNISSWSSQAANVMGANADAVIIFHVNAAAVVIGQALQVAGYHGAVIADFPASADSTLTSVGMPNFYALKLGPSIESGSAIAAEVRAAGASVPAA